jgi:hypothetical protein
VSVLLGALSHRAAKHSMTVAQGIRRGTSRVPWRRILKIQISRMAQRRMPKGQAEHRPFGDPPRTVNISLSSLFARNDKPRARRDKLKGVYRKHPGERRQ